MDERIDKERDERETGDLEDDERDFFTPFLSVSLGRRVIRQKTARQTLFLPQEKIRRCWCCFRCTTLKDTLGRLKGLD